MDVLVELLLYFGGYAFLGWIIESTYRTVNRGRLVNSGFLFGPFIPVFGFGGLIIHLLYVPLAGIPYLLALVIMTLAVTLLELVTGWVMHRLFGLMLWDYSDERFSLGGYICPRFSVYWLGLAFVVTQIIRPFFAEFIAALPPRVAYTVAGGLTLYMVIDLVISSSALWRFAGRLQTLAEESRAGLERWAEQAGTELERLGDQAGAELERFAEQVRSTVRSRTTYILHPTSKISSILPEHLTALVSGHGGVQQLVEHALQRIRQPHAAETREERARADFNDVRTAFEAITGTECYQRLIEVPFGDTCLFTHNERVARVAYRVAKRLGLDAMAVFRGALLRLPEPAIDRRARESWAAFTRWYFAGEWERWGPFSSVEQDIILYSTWPHSHHPPRSLEGVLVAVVGLAVAVRERARARRLPSAALQRSRLLRHASHSQAQTQAQPRSGRQSASGSSARR